MLDLTLEELAPYYTIPTASTLETASFCVRYHYGSMFAAAQSEEGRHNYDRVANHLYLGRLPDHLQAFDFPRDTNCNEIIKMVVSISTYPELAGKGLIAQSIMTPGKWSQRGIKHYFVHMPDLTADVSQHAILNAVSKIAQCIQKDEDVYLHCQAGMSRSAMTAVLCLSIFGDGDQLKPISEQVYSLEETQRKAAIKWHIQTVIAYITKNRSHVKLWPDQLVLAESILDEYIKNNSPRSLKENSFFYDSKEAYLTSLKGKNEICQLASFKELAIYAVGIQSLMKNYVRTCNRTKSIREFFQEILNTNSFDSTNGVKWYWELTNNSGHLQRLVEAHKQTKEDDARRLELVQNFKNEIAQLLELRVSTSSAPSNLETVMKQTSQLS